MKRIRIIPLILTMCLLFSLSCSEDMLKPKPLSFFTPENVYINKAGFESAIVSMRKVLTQVGMGGVMSNYGVAENIMSDVGSSVNAADLKLLLTPSWGSGINWWAPISYDKFVGVYGFIKNANVVISRIDNITWASEAERNGILAEALWHRSFWYYYLVNSYGDVPWVGKEVTDAKLDFQTHSRWTILDKITKDMEFAVQWLPATAVPGAITKGAGNHLLSKICLANCNFDKSITAATNVINGGYSLMTSRFGTGIYPEAYAPIPSIPNASNANVFWDLFRWQNKNIAANKENILSAVARFTDPDAAKAGQQCAMQNYNPAMWAGRWLDSQGKTAVLQTGWFYRNLGRSGSVVAMSNYVPYDIWNYGGDKWNNTTDLRRADPMWIDKSEMYYTNPASKDFGKVIDPKYNAVPADTAFMYWPCWFGKTWTEDQNPSALPLGGEGDWYIYRLAETYLIRAEAYYWKNNLSAAAADINMVRNRAKAKPVLVGDVTLDFIFAERCRELWIEELRHNELVRASFIQAKLNLNGYSLTTFSTKNWCYDKIMKDNIYYGKPLNYLARTPQLYIYQVLWPIPDQVIIANTGAVINQNIGYIGADKNVPPLTTIPD